jgi:hypothetical protein
MQRIPNIENIGLRNGDFAKDYIDIILSSTIKILETGRRLAVICVDKTVSEKWYK